MKLLLDQNISYRLVKSIGQVFPGTEQVKRLGLQNRADKEIWEYAKDKNFTIVTFDSDFYDLSILNGHPPKIVWIRTGNLTTTSIEKILKEKSDQLKLFIQDEELSCLEIYE